MDYTRIKDPIVREYYRKKAEGDEAVASARDDRQELNSMAAVGEAVTGLANRSKPSAVLYNRWEDMGKPSDVVGPRDIKFDSSIFCKLLQFFKL